MEDFINSLSHLTEKEKSQMIEIRYLMREIYDKCHGKDLNIILNTLDLLKEFFLDQAKIR